jgi:Undecaprenyl-phosphate glucose phosphotransferase
VRTLDFLLLQVAGAISYLVANSYIAPGSAIGIPGRYAVASIAATATTIALLDRGRVYTVRFLHSLRKQLRALTLALAAGTACLLVVLYSLEGPNDCVLDCASAWASLWGALGFVTLVGSRIVIVHAIEMWSRERRLARTIAVVGANATSARLINEMREAWDPPADIVGVFDDRSTRLPQTYAGPPVAGTVSDLLALSQREVVDSVIIALPVTAKDRIAQVLSQLDSSVADIDLALDLGDLPYGKYYPSETTQSTSIVHIVRRPIKNWDALRKRTFDLIVSVVLLVIIAPVILIIAALIKLDSRGPVLFRQKRLGFNNNVITVLKFRTMYHHRQDPLGDRLTRRADDRITRLGKWLRRTSLDELPQLFNVIAGDMSLVGPRPHALNAKAANRPYGDAVDGYARRHRVKPGITGWAQVNGWRGETETIEQIANRVAHDLYYIEHWSLSLDIKILVLTAWREFLNPRAF